ncbi:MAG: DHH family phosphoesterase [Candidatus Brocadiales bacterium]|nr:DHH family phosphoesterase [Candidatus Brocadiales bacterium]
MYAILGCDLTGKDIVQRLSEEGNELTLCEKDENTLALVQQINPNITVVRAEPTRPPASLLEKASVVAILGIDHEANLKALKEVRRQFPEKFVLTVASGPEEAAALRQSGSNVVVECSSIMAKAVLEELEAAAQRQSVIALAREIKGANTRGLAIFLQDNPDPDAIASGLALKRIAEKCEVESRIYYGGNIGHQQNRALVNLLETNLIQLDSSQEARDILNSAGKVALIEASTPSKNNILPEGTVPDIIVDHHQTDVSTVKGGFIDIETKIGATSSIMTRYIRLFGIKPDPPLATALLYGIKVDTQDFTRNATAKDMEAVTFLSPLIDLNLLKDIENPPMSSETLDIIGRAIRNREIRGSYLASFVEFINDRDALPQAAEVMLQLEGVDTVLVSGICEDKVYLSARSRDPRVNLALLLQKAFGKNAGGHATMAAGTIELGIFGTVSDKKALLKVTADAVKKRFFSVVGAEFEKEELVEDSAIEEE